MLDIEFIMTVIIPIMISIVCGLYIGSFLTASSLRFTHGMKLFEKRSYCDSCHTPISFLSLTPILGYLLSKGMCSSCNSKITLKYTIWEIIYATTFCINVIVFRNNIPSLVIFILLTSLFFIISVIDFETMYVYNIHIVLIGLLLGLFLYVNKMLEITTLSMILAPMPLIFKLGYEFIRKKITGQNIIVLGMGDVLIFIILFFLLDFSKIAIIMTLSGLFGLLFGAFSVLGKKNSHYPFLPSISIAVYIVFIWEFL